MKKEVQYEKSAKKIQHENRATQKRFDMSAPRKNSRMRRLQYKKNNKS